ncbi:MAG: class I SAM-dependent methyltransferase [Deltaproteobacteria bacterium]|nr:class I SAM-dependent methyltransferase [Deltaproteobacteria bacterium]
MKNKYPHYVKNYESFFLPLQKRDVRLLELGIYKGDSLRFWSEFFPSGIVAVLDKDSVDITPTNPRIKTYQGRQEDIVLLDRIAAEVAPDGFDVIIDDCAHIGELCRASFRHLFTNHLKPGGYYVIEDWGTGYWGSWVDGVPYRPRENPGDGAFLRRVNAVLTQVGIVRLKALLSRRRFGNHNFGMAGFVKELVDECALADITHPDYGSPPMRSSRIRELRISLGHVFVVKA